MDLELVSQVALQLSLSAWSFDLPDVDMLFVWSLTVGIAAV